MQKKIYSGSKSKVPSYPSLNIILTFSLIQEMSDFFVPPGLPALEARSILISKS